MVLAANKAAHVQNDTVMYLQAANSLIQVYGKLKKRQHTEDTNIVECLYTYVAHTLRICINYLCKYE